MDANEIFLPMSKARLDRIEPCLGVLPLYFFSTESQMRGEITTAEAQYEWALRQLEKIGREKGV